MANTFTPTYNLTKPEIGSDTNAWGAHLNADLDTIDANMVSRILTSAQTLAGAINLPSNGLNVGSGQLRVTGGNVTASGALTVSGATTLSTTLTVSSNVTFQGAFSLTGTGATSLGGALSVTGATTLAYNGLNVGAGQLNCTGGNVSMSGNLTVTGSCTTGNKTVNGTMNVTGATTLAANGLNVGSGQLQVSGGNVSASGSFSASGNISATGTLSAGGAATLSSTLGVTGATTLSSTLGVTGATTLSSTLNVTGATTLASNSLNVGSGQLQVSGGNVSMSGSLAVSGTITGAGSFSTLAASGATSLSSTLSVGGAATLSSNLSVSGTTSMTGNLSIVSSTSERTITVGSSGGYFFGNASQAGWKNSGGTAVVYWDTSGNFTAAQNVTAYSDAKLKKNIVTIEDPMALVRRMRGVFYERVEDDMPGVGVVAQEMQEVLPQVVVDRDGTLAVAYGNIVGPIIEALKSLDARLEAVEAR